MPLMDIKFYMERTNGDNEPGTWHRALASTYSLSVVFSGCGQKAYMNDSIPVKYSEPEEWDLYQDTLCACVKTEPTEHEVKRAQLRVQRSYDYGDYGL